jgi:HEAT repeat protein
MKNALKNDSSQGQKAETRLASRSVTYNNTSLNVLILYDLLASSTAAFLSGCNDSVKPTVNRPDTVFVGDIVSEATLIVQQALADQDPLVRVNAIEVVATTRRIRLMPSVQRLLGDEFIPVRFAAALAMGDLQYSLAKEDVARLLNDENENVRIAAAYAMSRLGSADSFEMLRQAIASSDQTVRANAALVLGKAGDRRALALLYIALRHQDSDDKVRFQAAESIAMLGDKWIFPKLWSMLISAYADVRVIGIRAMGALGTDEAKNALLTMLDDNVLEVRLAAAEQLGRLGDTIGEPEVFDVFRKNLTADLRPDSLERVNVFTALAIGRVGTARLTKFLPRLLRDQSKSVRIAAAKAVFQSVMRSQAVEKPSD